MSNEIKTRPLTPTEQKYTYAQSMQLEGQTGTIGHLRGDFATTGYGFYTTWFDTRPQWKSDEFKADLDTVINALREDMLTLIAVEVLVPLRLFAFLSVAVHRLPIWIFQKFRLEETIWHTTKPKKKRNGGSGKKPRKSSCGT